MNQVTNLIQWKNLTEEQKADFDFENYKYEFQMFDWVPKRGSDIANDRVYRLVIEEDKWYFCKGIYKKPIQGKYLICENFKYKKLKVFENLRPAKRHEIPKPKEKTLQERIQEEWLDKEVVMLEMTDPNNSIANHEFLSLVDYFYENSIPIAHYHAQSMKGFFRYVYDFGDDGFFLDREPTDGDSLKTIHPVAVLFEAQK